MLASVLVAIIAVPQTVTEFRVAGLTRQALVFAPKTKTDRPPLVFGFHGHGGNMRNAARSFQMHIHWPEAVVVYMQGLPTVSKNDPEGTRNGWQMRTGVNKDRDLKFFDAVYKKLTTEYKVDPSKVYVMGHSNGGGFTYLLWAQRGDLLAAVGPSGAVASVYRGELKPKPAFIVSGESDQIVNPLAQRNGIDFVKTLNGAFGTSKKGVLKGSKADVGLYVYPGGHAYPREANKLMVEFFKTHTKS